MTSSSLKMMENRISKKNVIIKVVNKKHSDIYCFPVYIEVGTTHMFQKGKLSWDRVGIQAQF